MRKILALGLLAYVLSSISTHLLAGEYEDCEGENKAIYQQLNVYGFCNAWHDADTDEEREKFAEKFEDRAGFPPPWLSQVVCPCFSQSALDYSLNFEPSICSQDPTFALAAYVPGVEQLKYIAASGFCIFVNDTGDGPVSVPPTIGLSPEQVEVCVAAVDKLISDDFPDGCGS